MPNSAALIWAPVVFRRHGSLSTGVGLFNGWGDTLLYKMTARSNKSVSVEGPVPSQTP